MSEDLEQLAGQLGGASADAEENQDQPASSGRPQAVDKVGDGDAKWETGDIPKALRAQVLERDTGHCRVCGAVPESPAVHHVVYRSAGGLNVLENLVTVHWMYAPRCHEMVHSNKGLWTPALQAVTSRPGMTALQWLRWRRADLRRRSRVARR